MGLNNYCLIIEEFLLGLYTLLHRRFDKNFFATTLWSPFGPLSDMCVYPASNHLGRSIVFHLFFSLSLIHTQTCVSNVATMQKEFSLFVRYGLVIIIIVVVVVVVGFRIL